MSIISGASLDVGLYKKALENEPLSLVDCAGTGDLFSR